jgi:hypothetical protein
MAMELESGGRGRREFHAGGSGTPGEIDGRRIAL